MSEPEKPALAIGKCSICEKQRSVEYRPFCSKRCADVDMNRWFKGSYAIPVVETDPSSEDE